MLILFCGSRNWEDEAAIAKQFKGLNPLEDEIMTGGARGADRLAEKLAIAGSFKLRVFPAQWDKYGRRAGAIRNQQMLDQKPDLVKAFPLGDSIGTWHMVSIAKKAGVPVEVFDASSSESPTDVSE